MKNKKLGMGLSSLLGAKETKKADNKQLEINPNEKNLFLYQLRKLSEIPNSQERFLMMKILKN